MAPSALIGLVFLAYVFSQSDPQASSGVSGRAIILSLLLFATVVIHEFGHAGVALAMRLAPVSIRIHALGGATSYSRRRPSPGSEAAIAAAGPAATLWLGLVAAAAMHLTTGSTHDLMDSWLRICIVLTIFNLLPGLPLDGGALVKSLVWAVIGDERKATRAAAALGMALTVVVVGLAVRVGLNSGNRSAVLFTALIAISIGASAFRIWQAFAPGGSRLRPSVLGDDESDV